jgi:hypothetical protein
MMKYEQFCDQILSLDKSIRYAAVVDHLGTLLSFSHRQGLVPLSLPEETAEYTKRAVLRTGEIESGPKVGKLQYVIGKYENLIRVTIPIVTKQFNKYYLMLSMDIGPDPIQIIENQVKSYISENEHQFF